LALRILIGGKDKKDESTLGKDDEKKGEQNEKDNTPSSKSSESGNGDSSERLLTKREKFAKVVSFVGKSYGFKLLITKMDGMCLELMIFASANIVGVDPREINAGIDTAAYILAWITLIYFITYAHNPHPPSQKAICRAANQIKYH
jgi:hypothetical protein